ncbi:replication initiation protein [Clostridium sp. CAG:343]|jgi:predicted phage replisome organizer|nr:replication initiation protein [Clostridium sp. CAG:343]
MYNLQWLKIEIKIFSNRKIQILLKEQDGDTYFRVWIQLLTIAIECNCNGKLVIGDNKPMTIEDFFKIMGKSKKKIEKIIKRFQELNMIIVEEGAYKIKNWDEYQSIESSEKYKEQNRIRQQKYRERLKSEKEKSNVTITENNAQEDNTLEEIIENNRKENENINGFREYKM